MMTPEEYGQAGELFDRLRELPESERGPALEEGCANNPGLRSQVKRLLEADRTAGGGSFLGRPAIEDAARLLKLDIPELPGEGTVIGNYRLGARIGAGGMGVVYSGQDLRLQRRVAIKILPQPASGEDTERVKRFQREARAASALNHPNIVSIFDADFDRGHYYIAMELIEGRTLRQLIAIEAGQVEPLTILDLISQTAAALGAAHEAGIVHRDVKPENIMVRPDGFVKVLDFGLAKLREPANRTENHASGLVTQPGMLAGTIQYMSPEQVTGKPADARSDIFSLGVVAYELATGVRPFDGPTDGAVYDAILHHAPAPPSSLRPEVGGELSSFILRALEKDPDLRFQTAVDVRSLCKRLIRDYSVSNALAGTTTSPSDTSRPPAPAASRRLRPVWPVALAAVALLSAASVWIAVKPSVSIQPTLVSFERQTDEPGEELFPGLSPDGRQFVYASKRNGNWDIYLKRTGGVAAVNLTGDFAGTDTTPAFSPDGTRIAFRSDRDGGGIFVMEATGENPRRVGTAGFYPAWAPDGRQLVCSSLDFTSPSHRGHAQFSSLSVVDLATGTARELKGPSDAMQPAWSPRAHRIAYWGIVGNTGQRDIFTVAADGASPPVAVTSGSAIDWNPIWAPSGNELYFLSDRGGTMNVWRVRIDEQSGQLKGSPEPVTTPATYAKHLSMAADGSHFAFVRAEERSSLFVARFNPSSLRLEGPPVSIGDERTVFSFSLSPDETKIAYDTVGDTQEDIWLMNVDGSGRRRLTRDGFMDRDPSWSPDGNEIAFFSDRDSKTLNVWAIRADGGGLRRLTDFPPSISTNGVAWAHDGRRVLLSPEPGQSSYVSTGKISTAPTPLPGLDAIPSTYFPAWNPPLRHSESDKWLMMAGEGKRVQVWIYSMSTGKAEPTPVFGRSPSWLPGQKQFISRENSKISIYDLTSGEERVLYSAFPHRPWQVRVTRDGSRIFFTQMTREGEIWIGRTGESR